jgi:hypothetical protein
VKREFLKSVHFVQFLLFYGEVCGLGLLSGYGQSLNESVKLEIEKVTTPNQQQHSTDAHHFHYS